MFSLNGNATDFIEQNKKAKELHLMKSHAQQQQRRCSFFSVQ